MDQEKPSSCGCDFCLEYAHLKKVLPDIPEQHRKWIESVFEGYWMSEEELSYKQAILDGSWPDSVRILEHHLAIAKTKQVNNDRG